MSFFDCNCSYGRAARPPHRYAATPAALLRELDFCGIDEALVYHTSQRFASPAVWNETASGELKGRRRLRPVWAVLPEACGELPAPEEMPARMRTAGVRALWAFPQEHRYRLDPASFVELFRVMAEHRIPLFAKENIVLLKEVLKECPDLIVVAVNQGPHSLTRYLYPLLKAFPNLRVDTSYLIVDGVIEDICERYGPERLLFGTAFPDNCAGGALLQLARADIGEPARAAIAGGNLRRLLREVVL